MNDQDMANAVRDSAAAEVTAPDFDKVWANAERSYYSSRQRYAWLASVAAIVAAVVIVLNAGVPSPSGTPYIELAELMDSTSWSAPSDVLLPKHEIDIYQDLPTLTESIKPAEGALL